MWHNRRMNLQTNTEHVTAPSLVSFRRARNTTTLFLRLKQSKLLSSPGEWITAVRIFGETIVPHCCSSQQNTSQHEISMCKKSSYPFSSLKHKQVSRDYNIKWNIQTTWVQCPMTGSFEHSNELSSCILHGLSPRANYTDWATAACRRNLCF
jgi:hypothetical protein